MYHCKFKPWNTKKRRYLHLINEICSVIRALEATVYNDDVRCYRNWTFSQVYKNVPNDSKFSKFIDGSYCTFHLHFHSSMRELNANRSRSPNGFSNGYFYSSNAIDLLIAQLKSHDEWPIFCKRFHYILIQMDYTYQSTNCRLDISTWIRFHIYTLSN